MSGTIRPPAVAGTWYPGSPAALAAAVDGYLAAAARADRSAPPSFEPYKPETVIALVAPHAGLRYSGPVAAHAYRLLAGLDLDVAVLVGPSHFVAFDGVAIDTVAGYSTPLGVAAIDRDCATALSAASPVVRDDAVGAHRREHSLEMQLPFLRRVAPNTKIVPLLMGQQTAGTAHALGDALGQVLRGRRAIIVASSDLSHYHEARTAARLDGLVIDHVARFDDDGLQRALNDEPGHACGGGPMVAVMRAARHLGAVEAAVLNYADSGDISGDKSSVVGYLAAAFGRFAS